MTLEQLQLLEAWQAAHSEERAAEQRRDNLVAIEKAATAERWQAEAEYDEAIAVTARARYAFEKAFLP